MVKVYLPPAQGQPVLFVNDRGIDYFQRKLATELDGRFDDCEFWSKLVLQLSHTEPSVRHAVSAISFIYRDIESSLQYASEHVVANPEAQNEWDKAVKSLSVRIEAQPQSILVPLVCSLLFTCVEFLRGNNNHAMLHAQSGLKILGAYHHRYEVAGPLDSGRSSHNKLRFVPEELTTIEEHVIPTFSRLSLLCTLTGEPRGPALYHSTADGRSPHEDLNDSRRRLYDLSNAFAGFINETHPKAHMFNIGIEDFAKQARLQVKLAEWYEQLTELLERMQAARKPVKEEALYLLLTHYKVLYIWIRVCTTAGEMATDAFLAEFEELVQYAERITYTGSGTSAFQPLSFDLQLVGPAHYATLKCRDPVLRRRALELLRKGPRREGPWNAHHAYVTAKRLIEFEERELNEQGYPTEVARVHGLPLPGDEARVQSHGKLSSESWEYDHSIVPSPNCPGTLEVLFQTKPWGLMGDWHTTTEYLEL